MIQKLISRIKETKAPICVGLDPMLDYIPEYIQNRGFEEFGETPAYRGGKSSGRNKGGRRHPAPKQENRPEGKREEGTSKGKNRRYHHHKRKGGNGKKPNS